MARNYWLLKTEPTSYSIEDLERDGTTDWTGVRNFQARNFIRSMKKGDRVLFYHSSTDIKGVYGLAEISGDPGPDATQFDPADSHFDPKAFKEKPIWFSAPVSFLTKFKLPVTLQRIKMDPKLKAMLVAARGSRLSVQPVGAEHFQHLADLARPERL